MPRENTESAAKALGFTERYLFEGEGASFEGLVKPDTDFDAAFEVYDTETPEWGVVSGWLCDTIEKIA